mmetsp:Transcript_11782/g.42129  ORF Transcript_11782/g.42129 Transcript_11782/m.42129 type:complete len:306 (+) Transcript_11782:103-1020(+)|eukprot:CAMPEP_0204198630 /NCGR_PEP_ID=MMETSP0361-20130328/65418_1 /ASSEMBLY_ACC=CAM_ASM_000343 /TAXON_ID=268821 /ORGANISM="Scrippsiella Hangoei, Strain SHTV-5" /LENGTH=305 /DNA_ID=CAMNT_0051160777 /DNA_START=66 /DNA_END=983 /DNA_ORIENTATION=-
MLHRSLRTLGVRTLSTAVEVACGPLFAVRVKPELPTTRPPIVFVPGMSHEAWYWRGLQDLLAARGYESAALTMNPTQVVPSRAFDGGRLSDMHDALVALQLRNPVMVGHSQGGLLMQMWMDVADERLPEELRCSAAVLYGTGALGQKLPFLDLVRQVAALSTPSAGLYTARTGKYRTVSDMAVLFFLPDTTHTTVTGESITTQAYFDLINSAQCSQFGEGFTTYTQALYSRWSLFDPRPLKVPSLVVFAEDDALYRWPHAEWLVKRHGADLLRVKEQAHCFADPGWEEMAGAPLGDWLDTLPAQN